MREFDIVWYHIKGWVAWEMGMLPIHVPIWHSLGL